MLLLSFGALDHGMIGRGRGGESSGKSARTWRWADGPLGRAVQRTGRYRNPNPVRAFDPVGAGFVESLARPGGNITGFVSFEYSMAGKWLETLKLIAPHIVRIAGIRDLASPSEMGMLGAIQAVMPAFAMPFIAIGGGDAVDFDRVIEEYAREPNGLIILPSPNTLVHRRVIMAQAARHRLPAIYPYGFFAREGGLISYGIVPSDNFRRAAAYVDRILKGARPGELPVQVPTKFELVINLKTKEAYRKKILRKAHIRESRQKNRRLFQI